MIHLLFFLIFFDQFSNAETPTVYVDVNPKVYDAKEFKSQKNLVIRPLKQKASTDKMPKKTARDAIFKKVKGLDKYLESMDQLGKDMLYIHAKTNDLPPLKKLYPTIPEQTLLALQQEIKKNK